MKSIALIAMVVALASLFTGCEVAPVRGGTVVGIKTPWAIGDREKKPAPSAVPEVAARPQTATQPAPPTTKSATATTTAPAKRKVIAKKPATQSPASAEAAPAEPGTQPEKQNPWAIAPQP